MTKIRMMSLAVVALALGVGLSPARADGVKCHPTAKKIEWHLCITGPVEYKRGIQTEVREECKVDKIVKPKGGCDFGDLASYLPEGVELSKVRFYGIAPKGAVDMRAFERQAEPAQGFCSIHTGLMLEGWELMKFSEAFDKANYERARMVNDKLAKQKKELVRAGLNLLEGPAPCQGKSARSVLIDAKTLSTFLVHATFTFPE